MLLFVLVIFYSLRCFYGSVAAPGRIGHSRNANQTIGMEIIFPDSGINVSEKAPLILAEPPKCSNGLTFCEEIDSYPHRVVRDALRKMKVHKGLFLTDDEEPMENRLGGTTEKFICRAVDRTIYPKVAKNKRSKWKYIINGDEENGTVQGIRIEICARPNGKCDLLNNLPFGYTTSCKQKYMYRKLMSLSENGEIVPDSFPIPSACCCSYRKSLKGSVHFTSNFNPQR